MSFQSLNLDARLLRAIEASGYTTPTEIQSQAIPAALAGRDLMASAQTGTGKTAAFVLPALQRLLTPAQGQGRGPRLLVLTPTRELAAQILEAVKRYGKFVQLRTGAIVGGAPYPAQERLLREKLDILVATPGRLIDHMERGRVDFSRVELLVLDEADRMLDMGFIEPVELISKATPNTRQTLLFSATLEGKVLALAQRLLKDPARIQVARTQEKHAFITQHIHQADDVRHKRRLLNHILCTRELTQAIVFTSTKRAADDLADDLTADGHACAALHGDMKQSARNRTVQRLRQGSVKILVATDVAARGLDIKGVSHVINFDLPMVAEDYVHRIGRTGRGGAFGMAVSLIGPQDWGKLGGIERLTGARLERKILPGLEPSVPEANASRPAPRRNYGHKSAAGKGGNFKGGFKPAFGKKSSSNKGRFNAPAHAHSDNRRSAGRRA
ncbi:MAG: DEAD/DEAH box helicase [Gammaproteobacteria bacterium]|nr:DEAD/DEAH box helicase [Gammaproteobacteria bacterium]